MNWLTLSRWLVFGAAIVALGIALKNLEQYVEGIGYQRRDAEQMVRDLVAVKAAQVQERIQQDQLTKATNAAKLREESLQVAIDAAVRSSNGLRQQITSLRAGIPGLNREAVDRYADTASAVFLSCVKEYTELAATADRIDSDKQTLIQAWPR